MTVAELTCPRCSGAMALPDESYNATSRRDNKTKICPPCGVEEALIDAGKIGVGDPSEQREAEFLVKLNL